MELRYTKKLESDKMRVGAENMRICFSYSANYALILPTSFSLFNLLLSKICVTYQNKFQVAFNIKFDTINLKNKVKICMQS